MLLQGHVRHGRGRCARASTSCSRVRPDRAGQPHRQDLERRDSASSTSRRASSMAAGPVPRRADDGPGPRGPSGSWAEVRRLNAEGLTILLTTHYLEEADQLAGQVAIIDRGKIVARGTPDDSRARCAAIRSCSSCRVGRTAATAIVARWRAHDPASRPDGACPRGQRGARGPRRPRRARCRRLRRRVGDGRPAVARRRLSPIHGPGLSPETRRHHCDRNAPDGP